MLNYLQAMLLGALQGITELFPVSSLGHSVILPTLLGWHIDQRDNAFLLFLVATHLATALVLLGFFFEDWVLIVKGIGRSLKNRIIDPADTYATLGWLIIVASIPAGVLGLLFEQKLKLLFASALYTSIFLFCNGLLLLGAEYLRKRNKKVSLGSIDQAVAKLSWKQSFQVGLAQCIALIPGFSRTGTTLGAGLMVGLSHEEAARFSFLLATPIIFAAAVLKLPELAMGNAPLIGPLIVGAVTSGIAAYAAIRFLTKYFKSNTLSPFAYYCLIAGALSFISIVLFH
jgi:undecaprenyl-diphosphatase